MAAAWLGLRFVKLREAYRASDLQSSFRSSDDESKHSKHQLHDVNDVARLTGKDVDAYV